MDPTLTAAAMVAVIAASVGGVVQIINAWSAAKERVVAAEERRVLLKKAEQAEEKVAAIAMNAGIIAERAAVADGKLDKIQETTMESSHNVNGNLTAVRDELTKSTEHSVALQKTVDTLAEILRSQGNAVSSIDKAVNGDTKHSLERIDQHTKAIEVNTARTDASVQDLRDQG